MPRCHRRSYSSLPQWAVAELILGDLCNAGYNIAVLLLAAGESKRFGGSKLMADIGGQPMIRHTLSGLEEEFSDSIVVVLGAFAKEIQQVLDGHSSVYCADYKNGMGSSIACGMKAIADSGRNVDAVMIVLADQVALTPADYRALVKASREVSMAAADYDGKPGVPAIFSKAYFKRLQSLSGEQGAKEILQQNIRQLKLVSLDNARLDIDTRQELQDYLKVH